MSALLLAKLQSVYEKDYALSGLGYTAGLMQRATLFVVRLRPFRAKVTDAGSTLWSN